MWSIWLPKSCDSFMWWTNLSCYSMIIFHHCYWMSDRPFFESDQLILDIDNWLKRFDIKERFMYDSDILLSMTFRRCQCQWQMLVCFSHKELRKTCTHHMEHLWLLCFFLSCWSFAVFVLIHIKYIEKSYQNSIQNHFFFFFFSTEVGHMVWNKMRVSKWQHFYIWKSAVKIQAPLHHNLEQKFTLQYEYDKTKKGAFFYGFYCTCSFQILF